MKKNKKDKKIKIDDISKDIIAALKKEIDSDAATGAYGTFLGYEEEHTKYSTSFRLCLTAAATR